MQIGASCVHKLQPLKRGASYIVMSRTCLLDKTLHEHFVKVQEKTAKRRSTSWIRKTWAKSLSANAMHLPSDVFYQLWGVRRIELDSKWKLPGAYCNPTGKNNGFRQRSLYFKLEPWNVTFSEHFSWTQIHTLILIFNLVAVICEHFITSA